MIPRYAIHGHKGDACLNQPPSHQGTLTKGVPAIAIADRHGLAFDVEGFRDVLAGEEVEGLLIVGIARRRLLFLAQPDVVHRVENLAALVEAAE